MERRYLAIDLKSFFASVECVDRGLDPLAANLVVADERRTEKTICLAVTPSLKSYGIPGRARLFEVVQRVAEVNARRRAAAPDGCLVRESYMDPDVRADPSLALGYLVAPPRMARYMEVSTRVYQIYLGYVAPEDIHIYSIDEVFIDVTHYLRGGQVTPHELARRMIGDVLRETGVTATAGIGTNLYLAKVAMDIMAKRCPPDRDGVRIAQLDELRYRRELWDHRPLTDFWRVGPATARKLESWGLFTMGDVARRSEFDEEIFYRAFGVNAGLLIDHAWGVEPCTIADIKAYRPVSTSLSSGQVLQEPYDVRRARVVLREMAEELAQELLEKGLTTDQVVLDLGYDVENLLGGRTYAGEIVRDRYGRAVPKGVHGSENLPERSASARRITAAALAVFDRIMDPALLLRRITLSLTRTAPESDSPAPIQLDLFSDAESDADALAREKRRQQAVSAIRRRYGKNSILHGTNFDEGATGRERHGQIGGHKA